MGLLMRIGSKILSLNSMIVFRILRNQLSLEGILI
jgi:hypothetical protein